MSNPYDDVNEDYGEDDDDVNPISTSPRVRIVNPDDYGIAGLAAIAGDMNYDRVIAPSGVMPPHTGATGPVARFNVNVHTPRTSPGSTDSGDDYNLYELANLAGSNINEAAASAAAADFIRAAARAQEGPNSNGPVVPLPPSVLAGVMLQQQQRQQQQQQQQHQQQQQQQHDQGARLLHLIRECENQPQTRGLMRLIASIETAPNNERVLQRRLEQLNRILQTRRQTDRRDPRRSTSVTYSRQIRNLRCRTARVRRALHAYLSRLRDQVIDRLRELREQLRAIRRPPPPHDMKGGKSKTKSKNKHMKRNKTIKRR